MIIFSEIFHAQESDIHGSMSPGFFFISFNKFVCELPIVMFCFSGSLALSSNELAGSIPDKISAVSNLDTF